MPVTIKPAKHSARKWWRTDVANSAEELLKGSCPSEYKKCKSFMQSSFGKFSTEVPLYSSKNGFVKAAVDAYSNHHHLTFRPEDVWFAILSQLSMHINKHAEELRDFFVAHKGKKELVVKVDGSKFTVDFGDLARSMSELIGDNVVDPELRPWIIPAFSTTTQTDQVVAAVMMMGAMQQYFSYKFCLCCGIPSVTLLGNKEDWQEILHRLEKLKVLGAEPTYFYNLLKPVLTRFVGSFDAPDAPETIDFWQKIAHRSGGGSGPSYLSGWITAFICWEDNGKPLFPSPSEQGNIHAYRHKPGYSLDDVHYHRVDIQDIPSGYSSVPVKLDDNGLLSNTIMIAGSVGIRVTSSGEALDETNPYARLPIRRLDIAAESESVQPDPPKANPGPDSIQPESGWWIFETYEEPKGEEDKNPVVESNPLGDIGNKTQTTQGLNTGLRKFIKPFTSSKA